VRRSPGTPARRSFSAEDHNLTTGSLVAGGSSLGRSSSSNDSEWLDARAAARRRRLKSLCRCGMRRVALSLVFRTFCRGLAEAAGARARGRAGTVLRAWASEAARRRGLQRQAARLVRASTYAAARRSLANWGLVVETHRRWVLGAVELGPRPTRPAPPTAGSAFCAVPRSRWGARLRGAAGRRAAGARAHAAARLECRVPHPVLNGHASQSVASLTPY